MSEPLKNKKAAFSDSFGGYGNKQFRNSNYLQGGVGLLYNAKFLPSILEGKSYLGGWYEGGSAFEKWDQAQYRQSFTGGVLVETPFGPVFIGAGINEDARGRFYFSFGKFIR